MLGTLLGVGWSSQRTEPEPSASTSNSTSTPTIHPCIYLALDVDAVELAEVLGGVTSERRAHRLGKLGHRVLVDRREVPGEVNRGMPSDKSCHRMSHVIG